MIPSIMCYVPPSVEPLGPTTPSFQTRIHDPRSHIILTPLLARPLVSAHPFETVIMCIIPSSYV